jgi:acyl-CoA thioester hydrolase
MLHHKTEVLVRFNEADPLGIVWHGHYLQYFEDGREAFGKQYGLSYMDFYVQGLVVPIVSVHCDYKKPLRYGDTMSVGVMYEPTRAAKLVLNYEITEVSKNILIATGTTTQVFVNKETFELHLAPPSFIEQWKAKWGVA